MGCSLFRYSCSKIFVIPLFLLKNFHYSIIPPKKAHIIPLFQEQNFRYSRFQERIISLLVILIPLFLFSALSPAPRLSMRFHDGPIWDIHKVLLIHLALTFKMGLCELAILETL